MNTQDGINRAKWWQIAGLAVNDIATNLYMWEMMFISYYLNGIVGVGVVLASSLATIMRVWDGVTDPMIGMVLDKTNGRFGKNRPFLVIGQVVMLIAEVYYSYVQKGNVDLEIMLNEADTPISPLGHYFLANELCRRGIVIQALSPRLGLPLEPSAPLEEAAETLRKEWVGRFGGAFAKLRDWLSATRQQAVSEESEGGTEVTENEQKRISMISQMLTGVAEKLNALRNLEIGEEATDVAQSVVGSFRAAEVFGQIMGPTEYEKKTEKNTRDQLKVSKNLLTVTREMNTNLNQLASNANAGMVWA